MTSVISIALYLYFKIILFVPTYPPFSSLLHFFSSSTFQPNLHLFSFSYTLLQHFFKKVFLLTLFFKNHSSSVLEFYSWTLFMALTQFSNSTCSKTQLHSSSQLSFLSRTRTLPRHYHSTFAPLHRTQHARISCSVAPK